MLVYGACVPENLTAIAMSTSALAQIRDRNGEDVAVPEYDRSVLAPSIVHIGVGGFHRAHLASYVHELCVAGHTDWAIVGSGVRAGDERMAEALESQDGLYALISRGPTETSVEIVGSIVDYVLAVDDAAELIAQIAKPTTEIVSLTITEGGYPIDDVTGQYDPESSNAGADGAFGIIAAALEERRAASGGPITIMSCDNVMGNGHVAKESTLGEATRIGNDLVEWIVSNVSFPNSMVDRITPATTPADVAWLEATHGVADAWPVVAEPFRQWVIEDAFAGARPPLEDLDVIVTNDVEPYEVMKLRLLNSAHSCLAYLAALDGVELVDEAMSDEHIRRYVLGLLRREATPVLPAVEGIDVDAYVASLIERFSNPAIGDQIARLCLDGTAKFPKFLIPTIEAQIDVDGPVELAALALAGWCQYLCGQTLDGQAIELSADPQLDMAVGFAERSLDDPAAFLQMVDVFGDLAERSPRFVAAFVAALEGLRGHGLRSTVDAVLSKA